MQCSICGNSITREELSFTLGDEVLICKECDKNMEIMFV